MKGSHQPIPEENCLLISDVINMKTRLANLKLLPGTTMAETLLEVALQK